VRVRVDIDGDFFERSGEVVGSGSGRSVMGRWIDWSSVYSSNIEPIPLETLKMKLKGVKYRGSNARPITQPITKI
jgi:hypothetical protein